MAALRGTLEPDRTPVTRLSHRLITARADTWQTFATVTMHADGSGSFTVRNERGTLASVDWSAESVDVPHVKVRTVGDPGHAAGVIE